MFDGIALPGLRSTRPQRLELDLAHRINRGLVGCWPCNDGGGSVVRDISPYRAHGTLATTPSWRVSPIGRALSIDGSSQYMQATGKRPLANSPITLSIWMAAGSNSGQKVALRIGSNNGFGEQLDLGQYPDNTNPWVGSYAYWNISGSTASIQNRLIHLGATLTSTGVGTLYLNGLIIGSSTGLQPYTGDTAVYIGNGYNNASFGMAGGASFARVYARALTSGEMQELARDPYVGIIDPAARLFFAVRRPGNAYTMSLSAGTFTATGQAVNLLYGRRLPLTNGSFTLSGQNVALKFGRRLALSHGVFALTGQAVTLRRGYSLPISAGTFSLSGQSVTFLRGLRLPLGTGTFTLSGQDVGLRAGRRLPLSHGSFTLTGQAVTLRRGYSMPISAGTFALTGQDLALRAGRRLSLSAGSFTLTGQPVTFSYSGSGVVNKVVLVWNGIRI